MSTNMRKQKMELKKVEKGEEEDREKRQKWKSWREANVLIIFLMLKTFAKSFFYNFCFFRNLPFSFCPKFICLKALFILKFVFTESSGDGYLLIYAEHHSSRPLMLHAKQALWLQPYHIQILNLHSRKTIFSIIDIAD